MPAAKAQMSLGIWAGSPEPSLLDNTIRTKISSVLVPVFSGAMQLYDKFLHDVWENHDEEDNDMMSDEPSPPPAYDPMYRRPPAPLPFQSTIRSNDRSRFVEI